MRTTYGESRYEWVHWALPEFSAALAQRPDEDHTDYRNRLLGLKPASLKKAYGSHGPTPEQAAFHTERMRAWNRAWRALTKRMKAEEKGPEDHNGCPECTCSRCNFRLDCAAKERKI